MKVRARADVIMMMSKMMIDMTSEELERKLKRERVEVCLNCQRFVRCESVGRFVECSDFVEFEDEAWVIRRV